MINVTDVAIMTSYLTAWTNTHTALARRRKDQNGVLKGAIQMKLIIDIPEAIKEHCDAPAYCLQAPDIIKIKRAIQLGTSVNRGRWIDSQDWVEKHYDSINFKKHCSICNGLGEEHMRYCPNCGSEMRGDKDSNEKD